MSQIMRLQIVNNPYMKLVMKHFNDFFTTLKNKKEIFRMV